MCLPTSRASGSNSPPPCPLPRGCEDLSADVLFRHACKLGLDGIVSKRLGSRYRFGRSPDWLKMKKPDAAAVKREAEEDWGRGAGGEI
jgi:hypothetical protein